MFQSAPPANRGRYARGQGGASRGGEFQSAPPANRGRYQGCDKRRTNTRKSFNPRPRRTGGDTGGTGEGERAVLFQSAPPANRGRYHRYHPPRAPGHVSIRAPGEPGAIPAAIKGLHSYCKFQSAPPANRGRYGPCTRASGCGWRVSIRAPGEPGAIQHCCKLLI